jgi:hypothetical protein
MDAGIFLTLGCDFTYACSWCLVLFLLISRHHESCCMYIPPDLSIFCLTASVWEIFEGADYPALWPNNLAWQLFSEFFPKLLSKI